MVGVFQPTSNLSLTIADSGTGLSLTKTGAGNLTVNHVRTQTLSVNGGAVRLRQTAAIRAHRFWKN